MVERKRRIFFKTPTEQSVYDAAIERINKLYDRFPKVVVSFSGGKDSTVCLNLCYEVAKQRNRLPLDAFFFDEEAIQPDTVDFVERTRQRDGIRLKWFCLPVKHRNACSRTTPWWYPWNPNEKHLWVRDLPKGAITTMEGFEFGHTIPDIAHLAYGSEEGAVADVRGLRADESMRRFRAVAMRLEDNWIGGARAGYSHPTSPIYDWTSIDVWTAPKMFGWDYNTAYDLMTMAGMPLSMQRVCPPFGEEPLGNLWIYAECWPQLWHKMTARVPGANTAGRYASSELYGYGGKFERPQGMTWQQYTYSLLELYPPDVAEIMKTSLESILAKHASMSKKPVHETEENLITGVSWKLLANIMHRGDLKKRRAGGLINKATMVRDAQGLTLEQVMKDETEGDTRY